MTGGPAQGQSSSSLDDMTEEEMEEEAEKLEGLLRKLDKLAAVPSTVGWGGVIYQALGPYNIIHLGQQTIIVV